MLGTTTLATEVCHVSKHGFWLLLADEELLVPFDEFPWFRKGTIEQISDLQWPTAPRNSKPPASSPGTKPPCAVPAGPA